MKYRAVIFDLDGTLLNTLEDLANCMNDVLDRSGFLPHRVEAYKYFVGDGMENLVRRALPEGKRRDEATVAECLAMGIWEPVEGKDSTLRRHPAASGCSGKTRDQDRRAVQQAG